MEICSIASGSSGNCICAGTQNCHLMIDAGISGKRIEAGLNSVGLKTEETEGILIIPTISVVWESLQEDMDFRSMGRRER